MTHGLDKMITAHKALDMLLADPSIVTVLDVGSGAGHHAARMRRAGKQVTTNSLIPPADIIGDFMETEIINKFNAIWAAHVLEHQPNPNLFLRKCYDLLDDDGILFLTVPPLKHDVVGGHLNLYNAGLLIYQCIMANFDCSEATIMQYSYNISLIVRKKHAFLPPLKMDEGDIEALARFFPFEARQGFDGRLGHAKQYR